MPLFHSQKKEIKFCSNPAGSLALSALLSIVFLCGIVTAFLPVFNRTAINAHAQTADTNVDALKDKIANHNAQIKALEAEIALYQKQAEQAQKVAQTLEGAIAELNATDKKLSAEIKVTEARIEATIDSLGQTERSMSDTEQSIKDRMASLSRSLVLLQENDARSLPEIILSGKPLSEMSVQIEDQAQYRKAIEDAINQLESLHKNLETKHRDYSAQKNKLESLRTDLGYQKQAIAANRATKNSLLTLTKNKETEYKKSVATKSAARDAFLKELLAFESELSFAIDQSRLPKVGSGVLRWPLDKVTITQYFGKTEFAASKPGLYSGIGHNGIDFRALVGTPVKSAASGTIEGTGDTDLTCSGASYGKWILVRHNNGLSTLYAHLSVIRATKGQVVSAGDVIGYSGNTGYSTGPHLHFTVYATQGVRIMNRPSTACGGGSYIMPVADLKAYLNPLSYL